MSMIDVRPRCRFVNCHRAVHGHGNYCEDHRHANQRPQLRESRLGEFFEQIAEEGGALVIEQLMEETRAWATRVES